MPRARTDCPCGMEAWLNFLQKRADLVGECELRACDAGEVAEHQEVLDVAREHLVKVVIVQMGDGRDGVSNGGAHVLVTLDLALLQR